MYDALVKGDESVKPSVRSFTIVMDDGHFDQRKVVSPEREWLIGLDLDVALYPSIIENRIA